MCRRCKRDEFGNYLKDRNRSIGCPRTRCNLGNVARVKAGKTLAGLRFELPVFESNSTIANRPPFLKEL